MDLIIQSALAGLGMSEKTRPREEISKIRYEVAKTIRSKRVKISRKEKVRRICEQIFYLLKFPGIRPEWLINHKTGKRMELDLCNYNLNLAIECQGHLYYKWVKHFQTYKEWLEMKEKDLLKAALLRKRKIKLLYVPSIKKLPDEFLEEFLITNIRIS